MRKVRRIGVLGAGAWGTALAMVARRAGCEIVLQAHEPEVVAAINERHENPPFLPGIALDHAIRATGHPMEAVTGTDAVLLVSPAQHLRTVTTAAAAAWPADAPAVICAKGIEQTTGALMSEVVAQILPEAPVAVLSGPTFAAEVARGLPVALTLATRDAAVAEALRAAIGSSRFRTYTSDDVIGAQVGGAVKNVLAIACGIVEGRGLGDSTRAALITRGLAELVRLAIAKGGRPETLMGLSGLGDLTLTCNAMQSRNFSLGVALGKGARLADVLGQRRSVAEGVHTAASVATLARNLKVEMPISAAVDAVLNHGAGLDDAISELLARPLGAET